MFIATADFHFHQFKSFSGKRSRFEIQLDVLHQIISLAKTHKATILFAGDLFDRRKFIDVEVFNAVFAAIANSGVDFVALAGNHDSVDEKIHSLETLGYLPNVALLHNTCTSKNNTTIFGLAPNQPFKPKEYSQFGSHSAEPIIILAHGLVNGAKSASGFAYEGGYAPDEFDLPCVKVAIVGDIHKPQAFLDGKVIIPGCPLEHDFGDEGEPKSVVLIDDSFKISRLLIKAPRFITLSGEKLTQTLLEKGDTENYYSIELKANAADKTEKLLKEKFPNSVFTRQATTQTKQRTQIKRNTDNKELLSQYFEYAKPQVDKQLFIQRGLEFLTTEYKVVQEKSLARTFSFRKVWVQNFLSFKEAELEIEEGVWLVTGKSDDPTAAQNSVGKSSLLVDAIIFCLYGTLARSGLKSKDRVIHDPAKTGKGKNCAVGLVLEINGDSYTVIRARKHEKYGTCVCITKNGKELLLEDSESALEKILNLPLEVLLNIAIFPQRTLRPNYKPFLTCTDSERKEILETALSLGLFSVAEAKAITEQKILDTKLTLAKGKFATAEALSVSNSQLIGQLQVEKGKFEKENEETIKKAEASLQQLPLATFNSQAYLEVIQRIASIHSQLEILSQPGENQRLAERVTLQLKETRVALASLPPPPSGLLSAVECAAKVQDLSTLEEGLTTLHKEIQDKLTALPRAQGEELEREQQRLSKAKEKAASEAMEIEKQLYQRDLLTSKLNQPLLLCHVCEQPVQAMSQEKVKCALSRELEKLSTAVSARQQELQVLLQTIKLTEEAIGTLQEEVEKRKLAEVEVEVLRQKIGSIQTKVAEFKLELAQDTKRKELMLQQNKDLSQLQDKEKELQSHLATLEANVKEERKASENKVVELSTKIAVDKETERLLRLEKDKIEIQDRQRQQLTAQLDLLRNSTFSAQKTLDFTLIQYELNRNEITLHRVEVEKLTGELSLAASLVEAFSSRGIISLVLDSFLEEFQRLTTSLCNDITLGTLQIKYDTQVTLKKKDDTGSAISRDKFEVLVEKVHGGTGVDLLSGSDQIKCNIIIEQALAKLAASHSNIQINLRVYDESVDGCSETSVEFITRALLAPEAGIAKYVITHDSNLSSRFADTLIIEKKNGVSSVRRA